MAGGLAVGACVDARGPYQPDGSLTAAAVDVRGSVDCAFSALYGSDDAFETLGPIRQMPASGTAGDWQIGNTLVRVWSFTEIDVEYGDLGLGVCVSARGSLLRDNSMLADTIEVKSVPGTCIGPHGVVSAASFENSRVSPGEMVSIFGFGVGPAMPVGMWRLDDGRASTNAGNVRVLFDGVAAPVVFATMNQINVVTPWSVAGKAVTQVQVEYDGVWSNTILIPVVESRPALFTTDGSGRGQGIFLNQNGTANSAANPAAKGSVVVLFGTGAGQYTRAMEDGEFIVDASARPLLPVTAFVGGMPAEVLYAGGAPNMIAGIFQVNVRIPDAVPAGAAVPVVVRAGPNDSQGGVTLAIR